MIPRILHRIWLGDAPIPDEYEAFWAEWLAMHPGWAHATHTEADVRNRALYDQLTTMSARSDLLRYEVMLREGGVYVDTDFEPLRPLDPLLDMGLRFFAGWEDHRRVCTALFGAEPGHPALHLLVDELPGWATKNRDETPDVQTGPVFFTNTLLGRHDVTLFPPPVFYPVAYWDRTRIEDLRPTLPAGAFALHHWGRSWMPAEQRERDDLLSRRVALLVPLGGDDPHRAKVWSWLRRRWQEAWPEARIVEGRSEPFSRARSINDAAAQARDADVYVIVDADSWCDANVVREAVAAVKDYLLPWTPGYRLNERYTREVLARNPYRERFTRPRITPNLERAPHTHLSGCVVVTREAFEAVGGFDEEFTGWGFEDTAFIYALDHAAGRPKGQRGSGNPRGSASLIHLWHPPAPDQGAPTQRSLGRFNVYRKMRGLGPWDGQ